MTRPFEAQSRPYRSPTDLKVKYVRQESEEKLLKYLVIESNRGSRQWRQNSIPSQTSRNFTLQQGDTREEN